MINILCVKNNNYFQYSEMLNIPKRKIKVKTKDKLKVKKDKTVITKCLRFYLFSLMKNTEKTQKNLHFFSIFFIFVLVIQTRIQRATLPRSLSADSSPTTRRKSRSLATDPCRRHGIPIPWTNYIDVMEFLLRGLTTMMSWNSLTSWSS